MSTQSSYIVNPSFTWERDCRPQDINVRELDILCKTYGINNPNIKIIIKEKKVKQQKNTK